jgi:hypothetical protein
MQIGFDNTTGNTQFVFPAEELREVQKIIEMFGWEGDADVDNILGMIDKWVAAMENPQ